MADEPRPEQPNDRRTSNPDDLDDLLELNDHAQPQPSKIVPEPQVVAQAEPPVAGVAPATPPVVAATPEDRLAAALAAIDQQNAKIRDLESRLSQPSQLPARTADRPEPSIEYEEVFPGRRVPKNKDQRPIKLTTEDLVRLGWNDDPARAIETLANAFFGFILDSVPAVTMMAQDGRLREAQAQAQRINTFWDEHGDLRPHEPFVQAIEAQALQTGYLSPQGKTQVEYNRAVGRLVRERIASMRGISYEQYLATLPGGAPSGAPSQPQSRAVTTSGARGPSRSRPSTNEQDRYLDDL